ncbi:MAG: tRNA (guanosine(46)-N7)-methyltransferase TrmB [Rhodospirillaceae bacterium]|nr:tRNA (guanosine(46)-N7)-methyltransferase TrmB [Rhodospirillaceae bacterium]
MSETNTGPRVLHYGRRKGKPLTTARQTVLDTLMPRLRIDPPQSGSMIDVRALFPQTTTDIWLEIGFGAGEHLATQAARNPDVGIIGGEVFINGVASLVRYVDAQSLKNIRIFNDDVRLLLPALPDGCLSRVFVLFPDPWPKVRHAKRRFIGPQNLNHLARVMRPGAELRIASDHPVYIQWVMEQVPPHPAFTWQVTGPEDWATAPPDHVETRYQLKAGKEGRKPAFFRFFRTAARA